MQGPDQVHMELNHGSHTGSAAVLCNKYSYPDQLLCREYTTYEALTSHLENIDREEILPGSG